MFPRLRHPETNTIAPKLNDKLSSICITCRALGYECYRLLQIYSRAFRLLEFFHIQSTSVQHFEFTLRDQILGTKRYKLVCVVHVPMVQLAGLQSVNPTAHGSILVSALSTSAIYTISHNLPFCLASRTEPHFFVSYSHDYKLERTVQILASKTNPWNFAQQ